MLDTTNRVTDPSGLIAVADASFVIGISLCQQWNTLKVLVETLIIADEVWKEVTEIADALFVEHDKIETTDNIDRKRNKL